MKLYRGISSEDYNEFDKKHQSTYFNNWEIILAIRESGDMDYPERLNSVIIELYKKEYLNRQYFTDRREIAARYAKETNGVLLNINISVSDILRYFILEFQNYSKRRKVFEIVYIVKGQDLFANAKEWHLKVEKP